MYIEIIIIVLSIGFALIIYYYTYKFKEEIIDLRKELEIMKGRYSEVIRISRNKKKLTRDRIKEIREYDKKTKYV